MKLKKILTMLLLTTMLLTAFTACESKLPSERPQDSSIDSKEISTTQDKEPTYDIVSVAAGYMPNLDSASLMVAGKLSGSFEKYGLDVTWLEFANGPTMIAAMANGELVFGEIGHGAHALCAEGKAAVIHCDNINRAAGVVANKSKGIYTAADLKGKSVAISTGTSAESVFQVVLEEAGLTMNDVKTIEMDANGMVTAMMSGQIDACSVWSPYTHTLENGMASDYVMFTPASLDFPSSYIVLPSYLESNRDVVVRFIAALCGAAEYRNSHVEEVAKEVVRTCGLDEQAVMDSIGDSWYLGVNDITNGISSGDMASWYQAQMDSFVSGERLPEAVAVENYVLFDLMHEGVELYTASK